MFRFTAPAKAVMFTAFLLPAASQAGDIHLNGEGRVQYTPDSARLQFTARSEHDQPKSAQDRVAATMDKWREAIDQHLDQLVNYNDARVHLYTQTLPPRQTGESRRTVTVASQTVSFEIHDLTLLNPILEQAQALSLEYHLSPEQFFHSEEDKLERQALGLAIQDARERCQFAAEQLDKRCGEVKDISLNSSHTPQPMMMAEVSSRSATRVSEAGTREVTATVSATFELDQGY